jgi:hypothetical protein
LFQDAVQRPCFDGLAAAVIGYDRRQTGN